MRPDDTIDPRRVLEAWCQLEATSPVTADVIAMLAERLAAQCAHKPPLLDDEEDAARCIQRTLEAMRPDVPAHWRPIIDDLVAWLRTTEGPVH